MPVHIIKNFERDFQYSFTSKTRVIFTQQVSSCTVNKVNQQRHYFRRSSHLISTVAGKVALDSWRNKFKSFVKIALHVYPFCLKCSLVSGSVLSSIKAGKWAWKFMICHVNDMTISSFSLTSSLSVSCRSNCVFLTVFLLLFPQYFYCYCYSCFSQL